MMEDEPCLKIILLGDSGVGKTTFIYKFICSDDDSDSCINTIGMDFKCKRMEVNGQEMKLQLWDTAG